MHEAPAQLSLVLDLLQVDIPHAKAYHVLALDHDTFHIDAR